MPSSIFSVSEVKQLLDFLVQNTVTDLFIISHGWNNDMAEARDLYRNFFGELRKLMNGGGAEFVRVRHGAGGIVSAGQVAAGDIRLLRVMPRLHYCRGNVLLYFRGRGIGEGVAEVLHNIQIVSAANHA